MADDYNWLGLGGLTSLVTNVKIYRSGTEVLVKCLYDPTGDRTNILFIPNFKIRLTSTEGRENKQVDFLIFYQGKSGILEIDRPPSQQDEANFRECDIATRRYRDRIFQTHGISIIQYYDPTRCSAEPDRVVQEFLETLSQAED